MSYPEENWLNRISPAVNTAGTGPWRKNFVEPARYLFDHELVAVAGGKCRVEISGRIYNLDNFSWIIIPPGLSHTSTALTGVKRYWVHFDWSFISGKTISAICVYTPGKPDKSQLRPAPEYVPSEIQRGKLPANSPVFQLLETLTFRWNSDHEIERTSCRALFLEILLRLLSGKQSGTKSSLPESKIARQVKAALDQMPDQGETLRNYLANLLEYSYEHLSREFKRVYGISPVDYLNLLRIEKAKQLLQSPRAGISQIAYACGFNDPTYFARLFKKHTGLSPSKFRNQLI